MKHKTRILTAFILLAVLFQNRLGAQTLIPSGTDVPRIISYQGQITNSGLAMNGTHTITATLYSDPHGKNSVWQGSYDAVVTNGIFNITIGSGKTPLPDVALINRSLWIGISIDNGDEMQPRTQLSSAPYALNVPDKSITAEKLSDELRLNMVQGNHGQTIQNVGSNVVLGGQAFGGGGALEGDEWIGSNNNFGVWFKTNNDVVMRYLPTAATSLTPNILGGSSANFFTGSFAGSVICGGGSSNNTLTPSHTNDPNRIQWGSFDIIGSGANNEIDSSNFSFLGGGFDNAIGAHSDIATIGGGWDAEIGNYDTCSFVGGGLVVTIADNSPYSSMVGGRYNIIWGLTHNGFLGGGQNNTLDTSTSYSAIVGGIGNHVFPTYEKSMIGGGYSNFVKSTLSSIVGGDTNLIDNSADHSFIGGGRINTIQSAYGVIAGGDTNIITTGANSSFIGGGFNNSISVPQSVIAGGDRNTIDGLYLFAPYSDFIGSGSLNYINGTRDGIVAGDSNRIFGDNQNSFIGSGYHNMITGNENVICGGDTNVLTDQSSNSFIGGGHFNVIKST